MSATEPSEATLRIDPELIGPEKELLQKLAEAEQRGDHETAQLCETCWACCRRSSGRADAAASV